MGGRVRGAEATTTTTTTNGTDENEEGKTRNGQRGMDGPPARGGFASTTSVDDDWRGVGDNRKDNQTVDEENERGGEDAEMLDEDDGDDDEDDASDVRFMDRGVWEASTPRHADDDQCWICLDGDTAGRELYHPCACPRWAHAKCMARWQLQCSGKSEEVMCKFCASRLPDWRATLFKDVVQASDEEMATSSSSKKVGTSEDGKEIEPEQPESVGAGTEHGEIKGDIIVKFNNISFRCQVRTGPEGLADFMRQIRDRCGIPEEKMKSLNLTYRCKDPSNGTPMTLEGLNESAFDAAVLCSAVQDKMKHQARVGSSDAQKSEVTSRRRSPRNSSDRGTRSEDASAFRSYK